MIDYTEQSSEELARLEAIAHAEGRTIEAALLDALAQVMRERDALQDELDEMETLEKWEAGNGPADAYCKFFHDCFARLAGHYPAPSVTSDYDKAVILQLSKRGNWIMSDVYETNTVQQNGRAYLVQWIYDNDSGAPWDNSDCHGPVSDWERRSKRPGERILNSDRGSHRFYDFQQAMKDAVKVWGCKPGPDAVEAVERDFEYLRAWCNDEWHYCGIRVVLLDDDGEETQHDAALWGIESDCDGYHASVIQDLIGDCDYPESRTVYPVTHCGV